MADAGSDEAVYEEDPLATVQHWGNLAPLVLHLMVTGAFFTLAEANDYTWAFVVGFVLSGLWVAGFFLAPRDRRWYAW